MGFTLFHIKHTPVLILLMLYGYTVELRNRFKSLVLIDRVPEELWTEVRNIVQESMIKTIPKKRNTKKARWLSEEALKK